MNDMITVKEGTKFCVDARELYKKLEVGRRYDHWVDHRITKTNLIENVDYLYLKSTTVEYWLTVNAAQHVCMMEPTDKGKEIRQWFLDRENELTKLENTPFEELSTLRKLELYLKWERQRLEIEAKQKQVEVKAEAAYNLAVQANSYNSGMTGYYTIRGYATVHKIKITSKEANRIGKIATGLLAAEGLKPKKANDERFGTVNLYPEETITRACNLIDSHQK